MLSTAAVSAGAKNLNEAAPAEKAAKARATVQKIGVGEKARVEVKLRDNTKLKGYVSAAGEDSFAVTDAKTGATTTVAYADAAQVKKQGGGLSPTTWAILGGAAAAAIIVTKVVIYPVLCDGGAGC
jgi:hypothetical protein